MSVLKHLGIITGVWFCLLLSQKMNGQVVAYNDEVTIGYLDNGLKYFIHPNAKPSYKLELRLLVNVGSVQEKDDQRGFANLIEHLMFRGTENYPNNKLKETLAAMGIAYGSDVNGTVSFDETIYRLPIPTANRANIEEGFKILSNWASAGLLHSDAIASEKKVIQEESRLARNAESRMLDRYLPLLVNHSRYANRLPYYADSVLMQASDSAIQQFYNHWYRPDLMAVVVVGDITVDDAKRLLTKYFAHLSPSVAETIKDTIDVMPYASNKAMLVYDKEAIYSTAAVYFSHQKHPNPSSIQGYRADIVNQLWINALNKRINILVNQEHPPFSYAGVVLESYMRGYENLTVYASPNDDITTALTDVLVELNRMATYGITQEELDIAASSMLAQIESKAKEKNTTYSKELAEQYSNNFFQNSPIEGPEWALMYYQEILPTISVNEVNKGIAKWIYPNATFVATLTGPFDGNSYTPSDKQIVQLVTAALEKKVAPFITPKKMDEPVDVAALKQKKGTIVNITKNEALGTTYYELSNGIKVAWKPTTFKQDEIVMKASNYGGTLQFNTIENSNKEQAVFTAAYLNKLGYGTWLPADIDNFQTDNNLQVKLSMTEVDNVIDASSNVASFEKMLQLLHLKLTGLTEDNSSFPSVKKSLAADFSLLNRDPKLEFIDTVNKILYNNSPLAPIIIPNKQVVAAWNFDSIRAIYNSQFKDASAGFFYAFAGNVSEPIFKEMIEIYLGSLPTVNRPTHWVDNKVRPVQGYTELDYHAGIDDKAWIIQIVHGKLAYSQQLELKANILMELLNKVVMDDIHSQLNTVYEGSINLNIQNEPYPYYKVTLQLPCGPENVSALLTSVAAKLDAIKKEGVDQKTLDNMIAIYLEKYRTTLESNAVWANHLVAIDRWEYNEVNFLNYNEILQQITTNDIKATANLLFGGVNSNIFQAVLYPKDYIIK